MSSDELKEAFFEVLDRVDGSIAGAAREIGVSRNTAYVWARRAGVRGRGKTGTGPHPRRGEYDQLRAGGMRRREAAEHVGINVRTARDWDQGIRKSGNSRIYPDGRRRDYKTGMTALVETPALPALETVLHPRYLTLVERETIADLRRSGASLRAIGRVLGRPASTIKRELDARSEDGRYRPYTAQRAWAASRARPKTSKLVTQNRLREYVQEKLSRRWSPEQISHTLLNGFPDDESMRVSPETIYQALYVQARGGLRREVAEALRTGRTRRKPHKHPAQRTPRFVDEMVMISERPPEVEDRAVPKPMASGKIMSRSFLSAAAPLIAAVTNPRAGRLTEPVARPEDP